jgi:glutaconate CoA-transferase subunit A
VTIGSCGPMKQTFGRLCREGRNAPVRGGNLSKVRSVEEAAALIPDGATIGIGGLSMNGAPMAFVRELVRREVKDLTVVAIVSGMAVDWLVAGGCVRKVVAGLISFEGFGLAPNFRRAAQAGEIEVEEYSEHLLICRLQAAAYKLPFVPTKAGIGTDVLDLHPDTTRLETDPSTGELYVACTPLPLDFAIVHAHEADTAGNVRVNPKLIWMDSDVVRAASTTIVTVERLAATETFVSAPERTTYPSFVVDAIVELPWGAYPTSMFPEYTYHGAYFEDYLAATANIESWDRHWKQRVLEPEGQGAFMAANGGASTIIDIKTRTT